MGICVVQYRTTIGLFNFGKCCTLTNYAVDLGQIFTLLCVKLLLNIVQFLLIISGNVHVNPVPIPSGSNSNVSICHVNIRSLKDTLIGLVKLDLIST